MKLPIISGMKVVKLLSKIGFKISRQLGSHIIMVKKILLKPKLTVIIPKHEKGLAKGTLRSIISQVGLTREEFLRLLKK